MADEIKEFLTKNGKKVVLVAPDFEDRLDLKAALAAHVNISLVAKTLEGKNASNILNMDISELTPLLSMAIELDSCKVYRKMLFEGLVKSTYENERITLNLFNNIPEAQLDYYEICYEASKFFLDSTLKSLKSLFAEFVKSLQPAKSPTT